MAARQAGQAEAAEAAARQCRRVDPYAGVPASVDLWLGGDTRAGRELLAAAPWQLGILAEVARKEQESGHLAAAAACYEKIIAANPAEARTYGSLADVHDRAGQKADAVAVAERAAKACSYSVGLSNLMGDTAVRLVDLGRKEEALAWGRKAAGSNSYAGLRGLAAALAAGGKKDEALQVYRAMATRYESGIYDLLRFCMRAQEGEEMLAGEVGTMVRRHASLRDRVADNAESALRAEGGNHELLKRLYDGPLSFVKPADQMAELFLQAMYQRLFEEALAYHSRLRRYGDVPCWQLIRWDIAARLAGRQIDSQQARRALAKVERPGSFEWVVRYVLGGADAGTAAANSRDNDAKAYVYWLVGVEAELRKDVPAAIEAYEKAAAQPSTSTARWIPRRWAERLRQQPERPPQRPAKKKKKRKG